MNMALSQADIERAALELGAPQASVYKWRERGIPDRWKIRLLGRFPLESLLSFKSLPRAPEQTGAAA